jgi:hypothetical protein
MDFSAKQILNLVGLVGCVCYHYMQVGCLWEALFLDLKPEQRHFLLKFFYLSNY